MKKYIGYSLLVTGILFAVTPIHDLMDYRIKGKSFSGTIDDNQAAQDGLGVLPLQHHTGITSINNELLVQKVFNRIVKSEDYSKTINIRTSLTSGTVGTATDLNLLNNVGVSLAYSPGSLASCSDIKSAFPTSNTGTYLLSNGKTETCDMSGSGIAVYTPSSLASCKQIQDTYPSSSNGVYKSSLGFNMYCDMTGGGWTVLVGNAVYADGSFPTLESYNGYGLTFTNGTFRGDQGYTTSGNCTGPTGRMTFDINFPISEISFKATFDWYNAQPGFGYIQNWDGVSTSWTSWTNLYSTYGATNATTQTKTLTIGSTSSRTKLYLSSSSCQRNSLPNYLYVEYIKVR